MVERSVCSTHQSLVFDTIDFLPKFKCLNRDVLRALYVEKGLSSSEIANQLGVSKPYILSKLKQFAIPMRDACATNPDDFRNHSAPFGYRIVDRKLQINPKEIPICRLVVELIERKKSNYTEVARILSEKKLKGRTRKCSWSSSQVRRIFLRWKGKL